MADRSDAGAGVADGARHDGGRAATEQALVRAARELLERDGVLAGLNLREVADRAGVNRALVYRYFGSRQELLRSALKESAATTFQELDEHDLAPFVERWRGAFRTESTNPEAIELMTLLMLDGLTPEPNRMPRRERVTALLRRAVERDELADDVDLIALHALLVSAHHGYALFRRSFAEALGVPPNELDDRVETLLYDRMITAVEPNSTD